MKRLFYSFCVIFVFCFLLACNNNETRMELLSNFVGCWVDGDTLSKPIKDLSIRKFSLDSNGNVILSQYEPGTQCRAWVGIDDIRLDNKSLYWYEFKATLNADFKTINLEYITPSGKAIPFKLTRFDKAQEFMNKLESSANIPYSYSVPIVSDDGWECVHMAKVGIDSSFIYKAMNDITSGQFNDLHSLLIVKNNKLVVEEYFNDKGKLHSKFITDLYRDKPHHQSSVTKSVISAILGVCIDEGYIKDLEEPLYKFFPEYANDFDSTKKEILLKHVITMSSGLEWDEFSYSFSDPRNSANQWKNSSDNIGFYLGQKLVAQPGTRFTYSGGCMMLLGEIIKRSTGMPVDKFAKKTLFRDLGVCNYKWLERDTLVTNHSGGLGLRPRDMAKIGLVYLTGGTWIGKRVISKSWVESSVQPHMDTGYGGYGYQWWTRTFDFGKNKVDAFYAIGQDGQFIICINELDLVIVTTGANFTDTWATNVYKIVENYILKSLKM